MGKSCLSMERINKLLPGRLEQYEGNLLLIREISEVDSVKLNKIRSLGRQAVFKYC